MTEHTFASLAAECNRLCKPPKYGENESGERPTEGESGYTLDLLRAVSNHAELDPPRGAGSTSASSHKAPAGQVGMRDTWRIAAMACGAAVTLIAALTLLGWLTDTVTLKCVVAGFPPMKVNTALGLLLAGAAVVLHAGRLRRPAQILACVVAVIGLATLLEYATSVRLGIDRLATPTNPLDVPTFQRMSRISALNLSMIGLALFWIGGGPRIRRVAQAAATLVSVFALIALLGYLYGVPRDATETLTKYFAPVAVHTAACFVLLSIGTIMAYPDTGIVALLRSPHAGGQLLRRLFAAILAIPIAIGWLAWEGFQANWYDAEQRLALVVTAVTVVLAALLWTTARSLERSDIKGTQSGASRDAILAAVLDAVITIDKDGTILTFSPVAEGMFGYSREEAVGAELAQLIIPDRLHAAHHAALVHRTDQGPEPRPLVRLESIAKRADGSEFPVEINIASLSTDDGTRYVGNVRDITERNRLAEQLRQAQKMQAVGQLAGGVAHDFNNLLTVIEGYARLAAQQIAGGPGSDELEEILTASHRAARVTRQLLAFSRHQVLQPVVLDLNDVVREVTPMLHRLIGDDIPVKTQIQDGLAAIVADRGQIEQVIVNLAVNARDAMPDGGVLTIETRGRVVVQHPELAPGRYVTLVVSDTGAGIAPDTLERIFEPFFTTKEVGQGTGLGLATVHGIVTQSGGYVEVQSKPNHGTSFELSFRASDRVPEAARPPASDVPGQSHEAATILVCEDEPPVRRLLERILDEAGYHVLSAGHPKVALEQAAAHAGPISLLCTDVVMPDMTGPELAARLVPLRPGLRTLFVSGYAADALRDRGSLPHGSALLEKPFDRDELLRAVQALLDQPTTVDAA